MEGQESQEEIRGQESSESLPPVEAGTNPAAAVSAAEEALTKVKAAEVSALADVLNRLTQATEKMESCCSRMESGLAEIDRMKTEIALTLAEIQQEKEAAKKPAQPAQQNKTGLAALLNP